MVNFDLVGYIKEGRLATPTWLEHLASGAEVEVNCLTVVDSLVSSEGSSPGLKAIIDDMTGELHHTQAVELRQALSHYDGALFGLSVCSRLHGQSLAADYLLAPFSHMFSPNTVVSPNQSSACCLAKPFCCYSLLHRINIDHS